MIVERSNITEILGGVPFSKNFSITQMQESLESALPSVKEKSPQLFEKLASQLVDVVTLVVQQSVVAKQAIFVTKLQGDIKAAQSVLEKVRMTYENQSQTVIGTMGSIPTVDGSPIYPTANIQTKPLVNVVTQANSSLTSLEEQLEKKIEELSKSSLEQKLKVEQLGATIQQTIEQSEVVEFDTEVKQYIYT